MDLAQLASAKGVGVGVGAAWPVGRRPRTPATVGRIAGVPKSVLDFDASLLFEPVSYREIAAEAMREYMMDRDYSSNPDIRQRSHFEGYLQPQEINQVLARAIAPEDVQAMSFPLLM